MKGKTYIVTSSEFTGSLTYTYNLKGYLTDFNININNTTVGVAQFFYQNLPFEVNLIEQIKKMRPSIKVEEVPADLSFDRFWEEYGKHGTKSMAKKKYEKLKPIEQLAALLHLPRERDKKKIDGTAMPYAETYINQKRWE